MYRLRLLQVTFSHLIISVSGQFLYSVLYKNGGRIYNRVIL